MKQFKTNQEAFWAGEFGDNYIIRNSKKNIPTPPINFFSNVFRHTNNINSVIELGSNIGLNLHAIKTLLPKVELSAVEINKKAVEELRKITGLKVYHSSIFDFIPDYSRDFVFTKGVLIHLNPECLGSVYELMHILTKKYMCVAEYYNPTPIEVPYHGYKKKLFKRDFAGDLLDKYGDLELIDYGFTYHRDKYFPERDDLNWFLLKKAE